MSETPTWVKFQFCAKYYLNKCGIDLLLTEFLDASTILNEIKNESYKLTEMLAVNENSTSIANKLSKIIGQKAIA